MESSLLIDIGLSVITATIFAYLAKILKQPLILGYIAAGILIGPVGLGLVKDQHSIEVLSELGLAFLIFIIGLEIDLKKTDKSRKGCNNSWACQGCALWCAWFCSSFLVRLHRFNSRIRSSYMLFHQHSYYS